MNRRRVAGLVVAAVLILLFGGRWLAVRYTEHAWYASLGQSGRFWALLLRAIAWQVVAAFLFTGWYAANTWAVYRSIGAVHLPRRLGNLEIAEAVPPRVLRAIALGVALVLGLASTYAFTDLDEYVALYRSVRPLGMDDPILQRDAAFYVARLPLLELLHLGAAAATIVAAGLIVGLYLLTGNLTVSGRRVRLTPHGRTHLVLLLCALGLVLAWGFHLDGYQLVGGGGPLQGALSPVDRAIRLPAANALAILALMVAATSALALRWVRPGPLLIAWVTLGVGALLGRVVVPLLADAWNAADTQTLTREVAQHADLFSRAGFSLVGVRAQPLHATADLPPESTAALARALAGVSAWSGEAAAFEAALAAAVGAGDTALPRTWSVTLAPQSLSDGRHRVVAIGVPQTDAHLVSTGPRRPRWAEVHRGEGAWAGDPVAVDAGLRAGPLRFLPRLTASETVATPVRLAREPGRLRFVPRTADLGIVGPDEVVIGEQPPGIRLEHFPRRLLLAWALQAPPLMDDHTSRADRVLYWRDLPSRLSRLYPFAAFDAPRAVFERGRLLWAVDGYVLSGRFPLARRLRWHGEDINFLSSAYLATVDANSGVTRLYLRGPHVLFARSIARAYRVEPLSADSVGAEVRAQLAYPLGLFVAQTAMLAKLGDGGGGGGAGAARWVLEVRDTSSAVRQDAAAIRPATAVLDLDGTARLWWLAPLAEASGRSLGAIVAAATDGLAGRLLVLRVENAALPSPSAAAPRLAAVTDLGADGVVRHGPVLAIPAAGTVAYVQAAFVTPRSNREPPAVAAIAVLAGGRVGVGRDGAAAVDALASPGRGGDGVGLGNAALAEARAAFLALDSARQVGDWERFGRAWDALRRALVGGTPRP